ncbi:uncharacterized protein [Amphiura filiformis]|uniref:uncharacterized protein n=1 Tax=Amphiura filiformis TaxID=82378 RepID=UPI003B22784B
MKAKKKSSAICDFIIHHHVDVLAITETWLTGTVRDNRAIADIQNTLPHFVIHHKHRLNSRGGGVAVIVRKGINVDFNTTGDFSTFEYLDLNVTSQSSSFRLIVLYRPPPNRINKFTFSAFQDEFSSLLETCTASSSRILLAGDFNIHVDTPDDRESSVFLNILESYNLLQHVTGPTYSKGNHTLDLLISYKDDDLVTSTSIHDDLPSFHSAVKCLINISRPPPTRKMIRGRKLRNVDIVSFHKDIMESSLLCDPASDLDSLTEQYTDVLSEIIDAHAPVVERNVILRPHAPWYDDALRAAKQEKRRRERKYKRTGLSVHQDLYKEQCVNYRNMLNESKSSFHRKEIERADHKDLFRVVDKLSKPKSDTIFPSHTNKGDLAKRFADFFHQKINALRERLDSSPVSMLLDDLSAPCTSTFSNFDHVSEEDLQKIIRSSSITSCQLDPLPTCTFKECIEPILPVLTCIVNKSLSSGKFPASLKHAHVIPLLKKVNLDVDNLANFRPISNLAYLGKLIERAAVAQLQTYLAEHDSILGHSLHTAPTIAPNLPLFAS